MRYLAIPVIIFAALFSLQGKDIDLEQHVKKHWKKFQNSKVEIVSPRFTPNGNPEEMASYLEACLNRFAPYLPREYARIDRVLGLPERTYLKIMASCGKLVPLGQDNHECTSWVAMPDVTGGKQILVHKNRDSRGRPLAFLRRAVPGKHAWIGNGSSISFSPTMGINDRGLVIMMNSGCPVMKAEHSHKGVGTTIIARILLENCATAKDAVKLLTDMVNSWAYYHWDSGSIWFIADSKNVFIVENTTRAVAAKEVESGFIARANAFHYPEMKKYSIRPIKGHIDHARRENAVSDLLIRQVLRKNGVITPLDYADASRISKIPEDEKCYPPCGKNTISATTFAIDLEYPDVLSSAYMVFSKPSSSCYLPIPLSVKDIPDQLLNGDFSERGFARADKNIPFLPEKELKALETKLYQRHADAVEAARKVLHSGGTVAEAEKLLQQAFKENWQDIINAEKN